MIADRLIWKVICLSRGVRGVLNIEVQYRGKISLSLYERRQTGSVLISTDCLSVASSILISTNRLCYKVIGSLFKKGLLSWVGPSGSKVQGKATMTSAPPAASTYSS